MITATGLGRRDNRGQEATIKPILLMLIALALIAGCGGGPPIDFVQIPLQFSQVHEVDTVLDNDTAYIDFNVHNPSDVSVWMPYEPEAIKLWEHFDIDGYDYREAIYLTCCGKAVPSPGLWLRPGQDTILSETFIFISGRLPKEVDTTAMKIVRVTGEFDFLYGLQHKWRGRQTYFNMRTERGFSIYYRDLAFISSPSGK